MWRSPWSRARFRRRSPGCGARVRRRQRHDAAQGSRRRRDWTRSPRTQPGSGRSTRSRWRAPGSSATTPTRRGSPDSSSTTPGSSPRAETVLLFGAGGAARACGLAVARAGAARIVVALREPTRAEALVADRWTGSRRASKRSSFDDAVEASRPDLIVNATPLGAHGEELPLPPLDASTARRRSPVPARGHAAAEAGPGGRRC